MDTKKSIPEPIGEARKGEDPQRGGQEAADRKTFKSSYAILVIRTFILSVRRKGYQKRERNTSGRKKIKKSETDNACAYL